MNPTRGENRRARRLGLLLLCAAATLGCYSTHPTGLPPSVSRIFAPRPMLPNPYVFATDDFEVVWQKTVAEVDKYFDIASENRLSRTIITQPVAGATLLDPWALDSTTLRDRMQATFQTMRKFAIVKIDPAPTGGWQVRMEVRQELEDMAKPDRQAAGRAVFSNEFPVNRVRELVGPVPTPIGWIPKGRDVNLEQTILSGIRGALGP